MDKTTKTWTYQNPEGEQATGNPTDSRGLDLRRQCGYSWVNFNDGTGWRQMPYAINALRSAELAAVLAVRS